MRNLLVAEIVGDHPRDLEFAHREFQDRGAAACLRHDRTAGGADQRAGERRFDQPQQFQRMGIEIAALAAAPDPDIADVLAADVAVGIDAPIEPVAGEKIIEELGPHQIALRHHLRHQRRLAPRLKLEGDGVVVLIIGVVGREIRRIHVQEYGLLETSRCILPDKGRVIIRPKQFQQMLPDRGANVVLGEVFGQQPEDTRQHPAF